MKTIKPIDVNYGTIVPNGFFARTYELKLALMFYFWCIGRVTKEIIYDNDSTRYGSVVGGKPLSIADIKQDFPNISEWTIHEWRKTCAKAKIIRTKRASNGYIIEVIASNKFPDVEPEHRRYWEKPKSDTGKTPNHKESTNTSDLGKTKIRLGKSPNQIPEKPKSDLGKTKIYIEVKEESKEEKKEERKETPPIPSSSTSKSAGKISDIAKNQIQGMHDRGYTAEDIADLTDLPLSEISLFLESVKTKAVGDAV